jgi:hypothetical protein
MYGFLADFTRELSKNDKFIVTERRNNPESRTWRTTHVRRDDDREGHYFFAHMAL